MNSNENQILKFKHFRYSDEMAKNFRDKKVCQIPKIICTEIYKLTEYEPVQGQIVISRN